MTSREAGLRASDADRERVAERLRHASAEGRLLTEELEQRLEAVFSARTYGQLETVLRDLPGPGLIQHRRDGLAWVRPALVLAVGVPIALVVVAAVVLAVTGAVAVWWVWLLAGWWFFGRHRVRGRGHARCGPRRVRSSRAHWA